MAIYDLTRQFLKDHIPARDRTNDQMLQAARSAKSNIVEGRVDASISLEMEIKLYGVAIGSLEELLNDYEDYIRSHKLIVWNNAHPRFNKMREFYAKNNSSEVYLPLYFKLSDEEFCNMIITLIRQNISMIRNLLDLVKMDFLNKGGIKEQMYKARIEYRNSQNKFL